jgi:hypothetical protein
MYFFYRIAGEMEGLVTALLTPNQENNFENVNKNTVCIIIFLFPLDISVSY